MVRERCRVATMPKRTRRVFGGEGVVLVFDILPQKSPESVFHGRTFFRHAPGTCNASESLSWGRGGSGLYTDEVRVWRAAPFELGNRRTANRTFLCSGHEG